MEDKELLKIMRKCDRIYHLAGSVGVEHIDKNPQQTFFNNFKLNSKLIPLFQQLKKQHIVFTSTSEIYGEGPFNESDKAHIGSTEKLRWGYAASKLYMEFALSALDCKTTVLRLFNIVGPGQLADYGMVLPRFIKAAKNNEDLIVYGDGQQMRSFCHIEDAIGMINKMVNRPSSDTFNVGREDPITIQKLAETVINMTNSDSKIVHVPYNKAFTKNHGEINTRVPDMSRMTAFVDYKYKHGLDNIIEDMI